MDYLNPNIRTKDHRDKTNILNYYVCGLTNPRPWRGRCQAGYSNTGGPPLPQKRVPFQKRTKDHRDKTNILNYYVCQPNARPNFSHPSSRIALVYQSFCSHTIADRL